MLTGRTYLTSQGTAIRISMIAAVAASALALSPVVAIAAPTAAPGHAVAASSAPHSVKLTKSQLRSLRRELAKTTAAAAELTAALVELASYPDYAEFATESSARMGLVSAEVAAIAAGKRRTTEDLDSSLARIAALRDAQYAAIDVIVNADDSGTDETNADEEYTGACSEIIDDDAFFNCLTAEADLADGAFDTATENLDVYFAALATALPGLAKAA